MSMYTELSHALAKLLIHCDPIKLCVYEITFSKVLSMEPTLAFDSR